MKKKENKHENRIVRIAHGLSAIAIHILQSCKDRLIGSLSMVNEKEKIIKYNELMSVIARLGTKPPDNK